MNRPIYAYIHKNISMMPFKYLSKVLEHNHLYRYIQEAPIATGKTTNA